MSLEEIKKLKAGDTVYYVPMSDEIEMQNPFLRTNTSRRSTYTNPLGVFETTITEIVKNEPNRFAKQGWLFHCKIDTTPFKHLIRKDGTYNMHSPDLHKYVDHYLPDFLYDNRVNCLFLDYNNAYNFYKNRRKNFQKNVKMYIAHLNNEINNAERLIGEAKKRIEIYSSWSD